MPVPNSPLIGTILGMLLFGYVMYLLGKQTALEELQDQEVE